MSVTMRYGAEGVRAKAAGGAVRNLLAGTSWTDEYLGYSAAVTPATENGEKLTDYIDISATSRLLFVSCETNDLGAAYVPVIGIGYYDSAYATVSPTRQTFSVNYVVGDRRVAVQEIQIPDTCTYVRIYFRTFGDSTARAALVDVNALNYSTP